MSNPKLLRNTAMKQEETQVESVIHDKPVNSVPEDKKVSLSTEYKISQAFPAEIGPGGKSDGEQKKNFIGKHVVVRECVNCSILSEKREFCFNLLENKLGHRADIHLEKEKIVGQKGPLQYFGKVLENCSKCGNLQIHSLFAKHNENSSLRLNLGGFSPVLLRNVYKTCESKGSDIECRLVILGARPRSSPAYAFLSDQPKPCSTYCKHCRYPSPNSHTSHPTQAPPQLFDYYTPSNTSDSYQPNTVSSSISSQAPLVLDAIEDLHFSDPPTSHLCFPASTQRFSPTSQHSAISTVHSIFKSPSCENPRPLDASAPQSGVQTMRARLPYVVDIETRSSRSCEPMEYSAPSRLENEFMRRNSSEVFHFGRTHYEGEISSITNNDSRPPLSGKEADTRAPNKRFLNPVDENEFETPTKKHPVTCLVSSAQNAHGSDFSDASNIPQSINVTYPRSSESEEVINVDCANIVKSIPVTDVALVKESSGSSNVLGLTVASQASTDSRYVTPAVQANISDLIQTVPTSGECQLKITNVWSSQMANPKCDDIIEAQQGKRVDLHEAEVVHLTQKSGINTVDRKAGKGEKTNVSHWSNEDVMSFLRRSECGEYADIFKKEDIDGQALLLLNEERLHSLLGIKMGPAMKIARHIRTLQASLSNETEDAAGK